MSVKPSAGNAEKTRSDLKQFYVSVTDRGRGKNLSGKDLNYSLRPEQWNLDQILSWIEQGYAVAPLHLQDYSKGKIKTNFKCSNLLMLDIDGGLSISDFKKKYSHLALALYTSPSHQRWKDDKPPADRYRALFSLPGQIDHGALQEIVYRMCVVVFSHDRQCTDACRLYFGNTESQIERFSNDNVFDFGWLHDEYLKTVGKAAYEIMIADVLFEHQLTVQRLNQLAESLVRNREWGTSPPQPPSTSGQESPSVFNIEEIDFFKERRRKSHLTTQKSKKGKKGSYHKIQKYDFKYLKKNCLLVKEPNETDHLELLHLVRNMLQVEGGRKFLMKLLEARSYDLRKRKADYYARLWLYFADLQAPPSYCDQNCKHYNTDQCPISPVNLLALQPRKKHEWKYPSTTEETLPLDQVRKLLNDKVQEIIDAKDGKVHLVIAETGTGKSSAVMRAKISMPFTIAGVTHEQLRGLDRGALYPELPAKLRASAGAFYAKGLNPRQALKNADESRALAKFEAEAKNVNASTEKRITHERLLCDKNIVIGDLLVIDEDIKDSLLKTGSVPIAYVKRIAKEAGRLPPTEKLQQYLLNLLDLFPGRLQKNDPKTLQTLHSATVGVVLNSDDFEIVGFAVSMQDIEDSIMHGKKIKHHDVKKLPVGNLFALLGSDYVVRDEQFVHFISRREIPFDGTTIILSATADEGIYRLLFGDRLIVHRLPSCESKGDLLQYGDKSFSSTSLRRSKKTAADFVKVADEANGRGDFVITHKSMKGFLEFEIGDHFGNTEGKNYAEGKNVTVIGTQNLPSAALKLQAKALGLKAESIKEYSEGLQARTTLYNGIEFHYILVSDDPDVIRLQLHFTYENLLQSAGRARYLEHPVTVRVYSNFPLPGFRRVD